MDGLNDRLVEQLRRSHKNGEPTDALLGIFGELLEQPYNFRGFMFGSSELKEDFNQECFLHFLKYWHTINLEKTDYPIAIFRTMVRSLGVRYMNDNKRDKQMLETYEDMVAAEDKPGMTMEEIELWFFDHPSGSEENEDGSTTQWQVWSTRPGPGSRVTELPGGDLLGEKPEMTKIDVLPDLSAFDRSAWSVAPIEDVVDELSDEQKESVFQFVEAFVEGMKPPRRMAPSLRGPKHG